jgi:hypothetical protein
MTLGNLFRKEFKSILPLYGVYAMLVGLCHLLLLYKRASLDNDSILVISLVIPIVFLGLISVGIGYYQLQVEWKTNSIYLLLSLPIRGWMILTSKMAAVLSLITLSLLWIGISFSVVLLRVQWGELIGSIDVKEVFPTLLNVTLNSYWLYILFAFILIVITQFTFLLGQLVPRVNWLVRVATFIGIIWLLLRLSPIASKWLLWTPNILFGGKELDMIYLHSGPFIVLLACSVGLLSLGGYILEKEVEV